jgi:hypothetical protein
MGEEEEKHDESQEKAKEVPLCLNCLRPVDPRYHYCPNCGRAVGQLTPLMPYESLWWMADGWGRMWKQLWSREVTFSGKLVRAFMIVWFAPVMLIGLIPRLWRKKEVKSDK